MAPEVLPHVFEPFFTTRGSQGGTGLGLASCYQIVSEAAGEIAVSASSAFGTEFAVLVAVGTGTGGERRCGRATGLMLPRRATQAATSARAPGERRQVGHIIREPGQTRRRASRPRTSRRPTPFGVTGSPPNRRLSAMSSRAARRWPAASAPGLCSLPQGRRARKRPAAE
ncbi:MAG: hypothetical protein IPN07_12815 [Dehalococcoidia bacterium]|nr:hypothetical protein [Dehalococcoidia bacterium]